MTKGELIRSLINTPHDEDTLVCIYLNEEEDIESIIGDIAFIGAVDDSISDRIDINTIYKSYWNGN